jgi:hypothetical protein
MKITLTQSEFVSRFVAIRPNQFSVEALRALYAYFEECEHEGGDEMEFDPIAICCEWTEYESAVEAAEAYGWEDGAQTGAGHGSKEEANALDFLLDSKVALPLSKGVLVANF